MRSLICTLPGQFEYADIAAPIGEKNHVIIKVKPIGICGTGLHAYEGSQPFFTCPHSLLQTNLGIHSKYVLYFCQNK